MPSSPPNSGIRITAPNASSPPSTLSCRRLQIDYADCWHYPHPLRLPTRRQPGPPRRPRPGPLRPRRHPHRHFCTPSNACRRRPSANPLGLSDDLPRKAPLQRRRRPHQARRRPGLNPTPTSPNGNSPQLLQRERHHVLPRLAAPLGHSLDPKLPDDPAHHHHRLLHQQNPRLGSSSPLSWAIQRGTVLPHHLHQPRRVQENFDLSPSPKTPSTKSCTAITTNIRFNLQKSAPGASPALIPRKLTLEPV